MEAILQGWLTKSPPEKKQFKLFGSKWRKRYFVLYAPPTVDGIPDARTAILEYYSSKKLHNKCGTINLSDCEEVLSSLDSDIYDHVFGLRTLHKNQLRTYYLAADTEVEMNKWVNRLCQVLGLTENDDGLSPQLQPMPRSGLPVRSLHMPSHPVGIPGTTRQTFQARPMTHQSVGGLLSPAPPPLRPVPSTPAAAPFSRLNISEPNLLDIAKGFPEKEVADDGLRMASPPGLSRLASPPGVPSSGIKSAGSYPELDRFSPTTRKPGHLPGEGREFMELPPIPPEKTKLPLSMTEPIRDAAYDLPKQKYYERSDADENEAKGRHREASDDDWYNSPPSRYNTQPLASDNSCYNSPPSRYNTQPHGDNGCYNSPPSRYNTQPLGDNSCYNSPSSRYNSVHPPRGDFNNMPPSDKYPSMGADRGLWTSDEGFQEDGCNRYNIPQNLSLHSSATHQHQHPIDAFRNDEAPLKPKRFIGDSDDFYNVPKPSADWTGRQTTNWNEVNGANWSEQRVDNWRSYQQNMRQDSEGEYNVPKSQLDKRKHVSQGEEFYNIPKSQPTAAASCVDLPRQKSDRRSYGGRGCRSDYEPSEDYDIPRPGRLLSRPESGHGDLGLFNIPGLAMSTATDHDFYNTPQTIWERTERKTPFNGSRPTQAHPTQVHPHARRSNDGARDGPEEEEEGRQVDHGGIGISPASSSSSPHHHHHQQGSMQHPMPPVALDLSPNHPTMIIVDQKKTEPLPAAASDAAIASDQKLLCPGEGNNFQSLQPGMAEMEGENGKSSELKKTPSGAFKQNKAVQSSTSIHKKQGVVGQPGLPLHDSIRFTQRTKSFKRSIPSQDRSTLPLPVKRIVERSESSSSSPSSDDEHNSDQNSSTHSTHSTTKHN